MADVDQGGKLKPRRGRTLKTASGKAAAGVSVAAHTHHVSQPHVEEEARGDGSDPLFGRQVGGHGEGDVEADEGEHGAADVEEQSSAH